MAQAAEKLYDLAFKIHRDGASAYDYPRLRFEELHTIIGQVLGAYGISLSEGFANWPSAAAANQLEVGADLTNSGRDDRPLATVTLTRVA